MISAWESLELDTQSNGAEDRVTGNRMRYSMLSVLQPLLIKAIYMEFDLRLCGREALHTEKWT